jgi:hypothetical protein
LELHFDQPWGVAVKQRGDCLIFAKRAALKEGAAKEICSEIELYVQSINIAIAALLFLANFYRSWLAGVDLEKVLVDVYDAKRTQQ